MYRVPVHHGRRCDFWQKPTSARTSRGAYREEVANLACEPPLHTNRSKATTLTQSASQHHSLLGPSLQKAGQDAVDQSKVAEIIYQASLGSKFFKHEEKRDEQLSKKIEAILAKKKHLESTDLSSELRRIDAHISQLDEDRDLSQCIVHVDCDAFYASVEELDRPELKNVPMAVGKGVLTTCEQHSPRYRLFILTCV